MFRFLTLYDHGPMAPSRARLVNSCIPVMNWYPANACLPILWYVEWWGINTAGSSLGRIIETRERKQIVVASSLAPPMLRNNMFQNRSPLCRAVLFLLLLALQSEWRFSSWLRDSSPAPSVLCPETLRERIKAESEEDCTSTNGIPPRISSLASRCLTRRTFFPSIQSARAAFDTNSSSERREVMALFFLVSGLGLLAHRTLYCIALHAVVQIE
jgi:hypothetical protein